MAFRIRAGVDESASAREYLHCIATKLQKKLD